MELDGAYVWITSRKLKPGSREEFSRSWRPSQFPEGMLRAYELVGEGQMQWAPDHRHFVGDWDYTVEND